MEAIECWLATIENPHTHRAYRREAYRLLMWSVSFRRKAVSSLRVEDLRSFFDWLAVPERHPDWPVAWRLVNGPLRESSRRQAKIILQALFDYLIDAAYLAANPFRLLGKHQRGREAIAEGFSDEGEVAVARWLEPALMNWLRGYLGGLPVATPRARARVERLHFLLGWLYRTAARRSELAGAQMGHIHFAQGLWLWRVRGKGGGVEDVPLDHEARQALVRYRRFRGLSDYPQRGEGRIPLVAALDGVSPVRDLQVYASLKWLFRRAVPAAELVKPAWGEALRHASTHWLRHSIASHAAAAGVPVHLTAERLRHKSHATTQRYYIHVGLHEQLEAFDQDFLGDYERGWKSS
ncbi:site-specific integrase [Neisseriaceae bacterium JH1-16]|nr:site-specific integrase [Neisseriaceae bacterium JH1-16]